MVFGRLGGLKLLDVADGKPSAPKKELHSFFGDLKIGVFFWGKNLFFEGGGILVNLGPTSKINRFLGENLVNVGPTSKMNASTGTVILKLGSARFREFDI